MKTTTRSEVSLEVSRQKVYYQPLGENRRTASEKCRQKNDTDTVGRGSPSLFTFSLEFVVRYRTVSITAKQVLQHPIAGLILSKRQR